MSGRSKYDILNTGYGVLNPEYSSLSGKNYNPGEQGGFFNTFYKSIELHNQTRQSTHNGPMVGICLRNEGRVSETGWIDPTCWAAASSDIVEEGSNMDLVQIRVRIPELHSSKPIPSDLPDRLTVDSNHDIINQYPVFISQFAGVSEPSAGDLVWVDFQDKQNKKGGIFLGVAEAGVVSKSESKSEEEEGSKKFRKKPRISKVAGGRTATNTTSRVFVTGDSNVVRMTTLYSGGSGEGKIDEFASFYPKQASRGELYENPKSGIGWKGVYERLEDFDNKYSFRSGDILIIGAGGNSSFNSLIRQDDKSNRDNPKFPGTYGKESGYSLDYFKNSGVDVKNQKYSDLSLLNKSIKESSEGYQNFVSNTDWKNFSKKMLELKDRGVTIKFFGPPVGGAPWRYINRTYLDQLQSYWCKKNGINYISIIDKSQTLKPNKNDVHYWNDDPSYTKFFNTLYAPEL